MMIDAVTVYKNLPCMGGLMQGLDGQSDPNSIHGGCEVVSGEKWSATKWMRQRSTH